MGLTPSKPQAAPGTIRPIQTRRQSSGTKQRQRQATETSISEVIIVGSDHGDKRDTHEGRNEPEEPSDSNYSES
jgi:hypothetical protein